MNAWRYSQKQNRNRAWRYSQKQRKDGVRVKTWLEKVEESEFWEKLDKRFLWNCSRTAK